MSDIFNPSSGGGGGSGTVTQVNTDSSLTGGPITTTGTLGIANSAAYTVLGNNTGSSAQPSAIQIPILGTPGYATSGVNYAQLTQNSNNFAQVSLQNTNAGSSASSDYIITADDGSDSTHFADFGINNSTGGIAPFTNAHAAYLYSVDSEVNIGALGSGGVVNIYTTGGATPVLAATFNATQGLDVVSTITTPKLSMSGNITAPAWGAAGIRIIQPAANYTDTTSSGTVAILAVNNFGRPTLFASSTTTYTNSGTVYIEGGPISSTNVTQSTTSALLIGTGNLVTLGVGSTILNGALTVPGRVLMTTSRSLVAWGTTGAIIGLNTLTLTDTSSSGTVATQAAIAFNAPTLIASSATTYTTSATVYISAAPVSSTNVTQSTPLAFWVAAGNTLLAGNLTVSGNVSMTASVSIGGTRSVAAWTTAGIALKILTASYTDTTSSGTVALTAVSAIQQPTLLASGAVTYTDSATLLIVGPPIASTNVTQTNAWSVYVQSGNIGTNGNIALNTIGNGLQIKEGSNARMGTSTLSGGTVTVSNSSVTANSRIFIQDSSGSTTNVGSLTVTKSNGVSFTVTSTNVLDVSTFNWVIFEAL